MCDRPSGGQDHAQSLQQRAVSLWELHLRDVTWRMKGTKIGSAGFPSTSSFLCADVHCAEKTFLSCPGSPQQACVVSRVCFRGVWAQELDWAEARATQELVLQCQGTAGPSALEESGGKTCCPTFTTKGTFPVFFLPSPPL